jgi:hypothetical protein
MTSHGEMLRKQSRWLLFSGASSQQATKQKSEKWSGRAGNRQDLGERKALKEKWELAGAITVTQACPLAGFCFLRARGPWIGEGKEARTEDSKGPCAPRRKATQTPDAARANIMSCPRAHAPIVTGAPRSRANDGKRA